MLRRATLETSYICLAQDSFTPSVQERGGNLLFMHFPICCSIHGNNLDPLSSKLVILTPTNAITAPTQGEGTHLKRQREREGLSNVTGSQHPVGWKPLKWKAFTTSRCVACSEAEGPRNDRGSVVPASKTGVGLQNIIIPVWQLYL